MRDSSDASGDGAGDRVLALTGEFDHGVIGFRAEYIGVVPLAAGKQIKASASIQHVVAVIAGQPVGESVSNGIHISRADERQVLNGSEIGQIARDGRSDGVVTACISDGVRGVSAINIGVVSKSARQNVHTIVSGDDVVPIIASAVDIVGPVSVRFSTLA